LSSAGAAGNPLQRNDGLIVKLGDENGNEFGRRLKMAKPDNFGDLGAKFEPDL
jgi:hypothetical protein